MAAACFALPVLPVEKTTLAPFVTSGGASRIEDPGIADRSAALP
jgi:hypothetical protein